jgi:hypothetical protein
MAATLKACGLLSSAPSMGASVGSVLSPRAVPSATTATRTHIHTPAFDACLLMLPLGAGVAAASVVTANPLAFALLLLADLWLLGYHHVVATYTRLASDRQTFKANRFLALDLLVIVTAATLALAFTAGAWVVASAFLYLQWFHYMRQGYGISRMFYRARSANQGQSPQQSASDWVSDLVIYLVPIYGIAHRSATMGDAFLNMPVKTLVLPEPVVTALGAAAAVAVGVWALRVGREMMRGQLDVPYTMFVASHILIFQLAYVMIDDGNVGWLAINVWHNLQYVMVVWMVNVKRYARGIDPSARLLSTISQPGRVVRYFATCIAISTVIYLGLARLTPLVLGGGLAATIGVYMGINFHHYIVDALIWKRRRPAMQPA